MGSRDYQCCERLGGKLLNLQYKGVTTRHAILHPIHIDLLSISTDLNKSNTVVHMTATCQISGKHHINSLCLLAQHKPYNSTDAQHIWRQKFCCRRATSMKQPPSTLARRRHQL